MAAPTFTEILDHLRAKGGRRGRRYVFTDADRDRIAAEAESEMDGARTRESADRALDVLERELVAYIVDAA